MNKHDYPNTDSKKIIYRENYRPPDHIIPRVFLHFQIHDLDNVTVTSRLNIKRNPEGASEYELYYDYFGIGKKRADSCMSSTMLIGAGITDRISVFLSPVFGSDGNMAPKDPEFSMGVFGTLYDKQDL